jgi:hypothetical protein
VSLPERNDLVTALRAVPGVADALLLHEQDPPRPADAGTLRLDLEPGADEVSVATAVNQLLRQEFGLGVDSSRIQLLEESESPSRRLSSVPDEVHRYTTEAPLLAQGGRLLIQRMQLVSAAPGVSAAVTLAMNGHAFVGEVDGAAAPASVHRSVAEATLQAVQSFAAGLVRLHLDHIEVVTVGEDQAVLVVVTMTSSLGVERLLGASAVREDVRQAVIRGTLDAINRRLDAVLAAR